MQSDLVTVVQKELKEVLGERHSRRGVLFQSSIFVLMMGVMFPASAPELWLEASPIAVVYYFVFPAMLSSMVASDAFAGERERLTLETLLATPLSDRAILWGKVATALLLALAVTAIAVVAGWSRSMWRGEGVAFSGRRR